MNSEDKMRLVALRSIERASRSIFSSIESIAGILHEMPALEDITDEERQLIDSASAWISLAPFLVESRIRKSFAAKLGKSLNAKPD